MSTKNGLLSIRRRSQELNVPERTLRHWAQEKISSAISTARRLLVQASELARCKRRLDCSPTFHGDVLYTEDKYQEERMTWEGGPPVD